VEVFLRQKSFFTYVKDGIKNSIQKMRMSLASSHQEIIIGGQLACIVVCALLIGHLSMEVVEVSSSYGNRELPIYSVGITEKKISMSFDAAWGAEDFPKIMEILDKHQVKATFFMTGEWVEKYPDCVKTLVEKGHDLGNHSATHPDMTKLSKEQQKNQIMQVHNAVKKLTGYEMELFRPPYGAYSNDVIRSCYEVGYFPIQWDVDSLDWKDLSAADIIKKVCKNKSLGPGSIILCHNGAKHTAEALDEMLTNLKEQGYELVPISELIMRENYHMDVTGMQVAD
jgi:polysaccharide deacetylase family sporulation protein PdaB